MKNKLKKYFKIGFSLLGILLLSQACLTEEDVIENENNIKYQSVSPNEATNFITKFNRVELAKKSNNNGLDLDIDINSLVLEEVENTGLLIPVYAAQTKNKKIESEVFLIKVEDSIQGFLLNKIFNKTPNSSKFSGIITITDLKGRFINGYKVKNDRFVSQFVRKATLNSKGFVGKMFTDPEIGCDENLDPYSEFCNQTLSEVTITSSSNNKNSLNIYPTRGVNWNYSPTNTDVSSGGGNTTSSSSSDNVVIFPCDDPLHGCRYEDLEENNCQDGYIKNDDGDCIGVDPTPCEMAFLSRDVNNIANGNQVTGTEALPVNLSGGWELNTTLDLTSMTLTDSNIGFNSAVYQKMVNGVYQYMYVTEGTHDRIDVGTNISQLLGNSSQYEASVLNAEILDGLVGSNRLYFTGHSLGGGLASVNSLATGRPSYTYNAAGLSSYTRELYDIGASPAISATVVRGEIVDALQNTIGLKAEGDIAYVDFENKAWVDFFNRVSLASKTYTQIRLHFIESVLIALDCDE